jgi:O-antigen/teichoic acid export membrane protein
MTANAGLRQSAMRGGAYLIGRQGFAVILKLIGVMLITRVLGPTSYGAYVSAFNIYQYALLLGQAGVGVYLLRHPGDVPEKVYRTSFTLLAIMSILLTAGMELSRPALTAWTGVEGYSLVMGVMAIALPFQLIAIPATIALERGLNYRNVAMIEIGGDVAYYGLAAPLVLMGFGPVGLGVAFLVQKVIFLGLALYLSRSLPRFGFDWKTAQEIVRYASTFSLANWIWQLRMLVNPLIAAPVLGARAVGLIGMTIGILEMLSIAKTIAWRLSVSVLGRVQNDYPKLRRAVTEGMELQTLAVGSLLLGFGWTGAYIVPVVFGPRWAPVMVFYPYIALSYLTIATFNVHSAVMSVIDRNRDLACSFMLHILLFGGTAWYAVRHYGAIGYGYAELATLPSYLLMHWLIARILGSPDYRVTAMWWVASAIGLFWRDLSIWAIAAPFVALAMPPSVRRLHEYARLVRRFKPAVAAIPTPAT